MVADRNFPHTDACVQHEQVALNVPGQRAHGHSVRTHPVVRVEAIPTQGCDLGYEGLLAAAGAVGAQDAHRGGDAGGEELTELRLGAPGFGAQLATAAGDVGVVVDQAGDDGALVGVEHCHAWQLLQRRRVGEQADDGVSW